MLNNYTAEVAFRYWDEFGFVEDRVVKRDVTKEVHEGMTDEEIVWSLFCREAMMKHESAVLTKGQVYFSR